MGCFQVFEDHEGIEADILRRLAGLGGRPEARSAGQRPALLVVSPRAALRGPIAAACRTALLPGDPPLPELELQAASAVSYGAGPRNTLTISSRTVDLALGGPSAGAGHRPGTGGGAAGVPLASLSRGLPPGGAGSGRGPSAAGDPPGAARRPLPVKSCPSA